MEILGESSGAAAISALAVALSLSVGARHHPRLFEHDRLVQRPVGAKRMFREGLQILRQGPERTSRKTKRALRRHEIGASSHDHRVLLV